MENIVRNVRDLPLSDRSALERLVGHELRETQQVVLNVVEVESAEVPVPAADVPEWWNVYHGLSDEEIDRIDEAIRQRANLTRTFE